VLAACLAGVLVGWHGSSSPFISTLPVIVLIIPADGRTAKALTSDKEHGAWRNQFLKP
jgi:hypothetical protein